MMTRRTAIAAATATAVTAAGADGSRAALVRAAPTVRTPLAFRVPPGAADCHVHVVYDQARFPMDPARVYTPPTATPRMLLDLQHALHLDHVVIVTPSFYGTDNRATLAGIKELGQRRARGVAVVGEHATKAELDDLHAAGIRGIRMNLETSGITDPDASARRLDTMAALIAGRPWHLQMYARMSVIAALHDRFAALPVPSVFDHFAGADAAKGVQQPGFDAVLDLVKSGKSYVKISGAYRASKAGPVYADTAPLARALIAANPDRMVWGTDWPHTDSASVPGRKTTDIAPPQDIDDGHLLNLVAEWAPDAPTRQKILVDNPKRLYGFA